MISGPRRLLLLSTAAAVLQPEPVRLSQSANAAAKIRVAQAVMDTSFTSKDEAFGQERQPAAASCRL
uniref:Uncharacterized protein n=1 Tax=Oryza punctata TaxID=4537 RepID=A0A0E0JIY3_ORYPU